MSTQMIIRIEPEVKDKFSKIARQEGKATSQMIRELMEEYINERDISSYVGNLWDSVGNKLKAKGVNQSDINKHIKNVRKKKS